MKNICNVMACLILGFSISGCSGPKGGVGPGMEPQEAVMKEIGDLLRSGTGKAKSLGELAQFEAHFPKAYQAIKSGDFVVEWNNSMLGEGEANSNPGTIIASEKSAKTSGGWVLLNNGAAKKVTAAEIDGLGKSAK